MSDRVDFDKYADNYNELLHERTRFFADGEEYFARYKVDVLRRHVGVPVGRLLEYGCGIGRNVPFLRRSFPDATIVGSDISAESLEVARRDNPGMEFFEEDRGARQAMPSFDVVFVAGVFHHVPVDVRAAVATTLFSRLRPGGQLFVFEHNPLNPVTRHIVSTCPYDADAVLLRRSRLCTLLRAAGMTIVRSAYCLFAPPRFPAIASREHLIGWLPLGGQYWVQAERQA